MNFGERRRDFRKGEEVADFAKRTNYVAQLGADASPFSQITESASIRIRKYSQGHNMAANTLEAKAHELLGYLGPSQLAAVVRLLEVMVDEEDEELTEEDRRAIAASREYFRQNPEGGLTFEQVAAECGFTK